MILLVNKKYTIYTQHNAVGVVGKNKIRAGGARNKHPESIESIDVIKTTIKLFPSPLCHELKTNQCSKPGRDILNGL